MYKRNLLRPLCSVLMAFLTVGIGAVPAFTAADTRSVNISIPYQTNDDKAQSYEYLYVVGGYHSIDNGCPAWGTADLKNVRMIGDTMGWVVVTYTDGSTQRIPLVFGYTLWYHALWLEVSAPFKQGDHAPELTRTLKDTLALMGAFEGNDTCVFRIKLDAKPIRSVVLEDNPDKEGSPVFKGAAMTSGPAGSLTINGLTFKSQDTFFDTHTVNAADPLPQAIVDNLAYLNRALMTYEDDYNAAPVFEFPTDYAGSRTVFSGNPFANIATGSVYHNALNIAGRVDRSGMLHTSYKDAPSWRYDGFGCWVEKANSYYTTYYSRDGGRALMSLNEYGYVDKSEASVLFADKQMTYFSRQHLTIGGVPIPGHFTVVLNDPMLYSKVLVPQAGWATQYTRDAFGDEYQNLGNQETDGHGLMMMANYSTWKNLGSSPSWVKSNWKALHEAPEWIEWCYEHPELSFVKDGLLYSESEGGMMKYTMYCNIPCMLGMYGYAEMAEAGGYAEEAATWRATADSMKTAIERRFLLPESGTWDLSSFGFFHDPALDMLADYFGYNIETWPEAYAEWVKASCETYPSDLTSVSDFDWYGAGGIGYHHCMITQNALLTDHMADATTLVENLCRISYAPRLPDPYFIPEGITYNHETGAMRRQGDLGNLVQAAEALKCFDIVVGISPASNGSLSITPRLPAGWDVSAADRFVQYTVARADLSVTYPRDGMQTASVRLSDSADISSVTFRFGPLPADTQYAAVNVNGVDAACRLSSSGDSAWVYVTYENRDGEAADLVLMYSDTADGLGTFPASETETGSDPETTPTAADTDLGSDADTYAVTGSASSGCRSSAAGLSVLAAAVPALLSTGAAPRKKRKPTGV